MLTLSLAESVGWFLAVGGGFFLLGYSAKDWEFRNRGRR